MRKTMAWSETLVESHDARVRRERLEDTTRDKSAGFHLDAHSVRFDMEEK